MIETIHLDHFISSNSTMKAIKKECKMTHTHTHTHTHTQTHTHTYIHTHMHTHIHISFFLDYHSILLVDCNACATVARGYVYLFEHHLAGDLVYYRLLFRVKLRVAQESAESKNSELRYPFLLSRLRSYLTCGYDVP